jgi:hypothetical protein
VARAVYDAAVQVGLADLMPAFKARAAAVQTSADIWDARDWLNGRQRQIDFKYDGRYSQLIGVLTLLPRKARIQLSQPSVLADGKHHVFPVR